MEELRGGMGEARRSPVSLPAKKLHFQTSYSLTSNQWASKEYTNDKTWGQILYEPYTAARGLLVVGVRFSPQNSSTCSMNVPTSVTL